MCGICGFNWANNELLEKMMDSMRHRGPDDSGIYLSDGLSLGHLRLSIIDLSSLGHQPMCNEDQSIWITYNGEIYNYLPLKTELEGLGHVFKSHSDTEVIIHSYEEWGYKCVEKFNGMWAFCIYDKKNGILFLSRDRFGIKPIYYLIDEDRFIFASEIPPIRESGIKTQPNDKLIYDLLLYNITDHTDETFHAPIRRLPKASYGIYDLKKRALSITTWWGPRSRAEKIDYDVAVKKLRDILSDSIHLHLQSDVPVGTCLSGGLDSSTIACLIESSKKTEIKTFSAVFPGFGLDESRYIDTVSTTRQMSNFKTAPTAQGLKTDIYDFIRFQGEPVPGPSPYAHYCVMRLAKEHNVTVLLDGQGSDEILAGYNYFYGFYLRGLLSKFQIRAFMSGLFHLLTSPQLRLDLYSLIFLLMPSSLRQQYFLKKSNLNKNLSNKFSGDFAGKFYSCPTLKEALIFHLNYRLEHLLTWEDRNSMRFSRESRVPFLDFRITEFILGLPEEYIVALGYKKKILRDAMRGIVPDEILSRKDKIGFATPEEEWLKTTEMIELLDKLFLKNKPLCAEYINLEKTREIIKQHINGKKGHGRLLWRAIFLEVWLQKFYA